MLDPATGTFFDLLGARLLPLFHKPPPDPKAYQSSVSTSIPHLFVNAQEKCTTEEWFERLTANSSIYDNCEVVSLTWAKALESAMSHEYIQFIVEDTRTGARTRVFTDRQKDADHVIVGWNFSSKTNPSGQTDLPLPLSSLNFHAPRPKVIALATVMRVVTQKAPKYSLLTGKMCWWYAQTVFDTCSHRFIPSEVKDWLYSQYKAVLIVWTIYSERADLTDAAEKFRQQNISRVAYLRPSGGPRLFTTKGYLQPIVHRLLVDQGAQDLYQELLQLDNTEKLDVTGFTEALNIAAKAPETVDQKTINNFQEAGDYFANVIFDDSELKENTEAYNIAEEKIYCSSKGMPYPLTDEDGLRLKLMPTKPLFYGPKAEKRERFDEAMRAHVGAILRELEE